MNYISFFDCVCSQGWFEFAFPMQFCNTNCGSCINNSGVWCNHGSFNVSVDDLSVLINGSFCWQGNLFEFTNTKYTVNSIDYETQCNDPLHIPQWKQCGVYGYIPIIVSAIGIAFLLIAIIIGIYICYCYCKKNNTSTEIQPLIYKSSNNLALPGQHRNSYRIISIICQYCNEAVLESAYNEHVQKHQINPQPQYYSVQY